MNDKDVTSKLEKMGYVHPENTSNNRENIYSTYSSTSDTPYSRTEYSTYSTYDIYDEVDQTICPKCKGKALYLCECVYQDKMCKNNHIWYYTDKKNFVLEDPHEDD